MDGIVAVDREDGQQGYILELNAILDFIRPMEHSLLCPVQARINGIFIDDVAERRIRELQNAARTLMLHAIKR